MLVEFCQIEFEAKSSKFSSIFGIPARSTVEDRLAVIFLIAFTSVEPHVLCHVCRKVQGILFFCERMCIYISLDPLGPKSCAMYIIQTCFFLPW